jgi:hypothetical protein
LTILKNSNTFFCKKEILMTDNNTTKQTAAPAAPAASTATTAATAANALTPVTLHVNDIVNGTILLKVAIERGAFKAEEIAEVGNVYSKLNSFVQYLQAVASAESQAAAKAETAKTEAKATETNAPAETSKKKRGSKKSN